MSTSKDFLERLKVHYRYEPIIEGGVKSKTFSEMTKAEFENFEGAMKEKLLNYTVESDHIVQQLVDDVMPILNSTEKTMVADVAFGKIYNTKLNAFCAKSQDGFDNYCIVINEGLLMLLHKYGKLLLATHSPESVIFCNRGNVSLITKEDYSNWAQELIGNYKQYNAPVGAMLKLKPEASTQHHFSLHLQELFVLCHELGHLFNKDLEDKHNLTYLIPSEAEIIEENKHYQIEFNADLYAFDLLSRIAKRNYNLEKKFILSFVVTLFDIMALINPNRGGKHPAPIERIINIVQSNWGKDVAYRYLKTYDGSVTYDDFFNIL